jgi:hypothetical protein
MSSTEPLQQQSEDKVTFIVKNSTRSRFIAKLIITAGLVVITSYFFIQSSAKQYQKGRALTQESYLKDFEQYKQSLLKARDYTNIPLSSLACLIVISFLVGSYELLALVIGLMIGKIIKL